MGYFSQRKKRQRENTFLTIALSALVILLLTRALGSQNDFAFWIDSHLFQLYLFNIFIALFALLHKKIIGSIIALLILLLIYTNISSTANIFSNTKVEGGEEFTLTYKDASESPQSLAESLDKKAVHLGRIKLAPDYDADFATFDQKGKAFTVVRVDFSGLDLQLQPVLFENLAEFVASKDEPVIIFGNFGVPSWSHNFKNFLRQTSLEVKNRIILRDLEHRFNAFGMPVINLIGYNNTGLKSIDFVDFTAEHPAEIKFTVQYR